jgi:hypothetical protein
MDTELLDLIEQTDSVELAQVAYSISDRFKQYQRYIIAELIDRGDYGYYEYLCINGTDC